MSTTTSDIKSTTFWRKSYAVEAIRLTNDNIQKVADEIDGSLGETADGDPIVIFNSVVGRVQAAIGDWLIQISEGRFYRMEDEAFARKYSTHSERAAEDEKYAKVHNLVLEAMRKQDTATYHGDSNGMDLVAVEITKKLLNEL
ncbi:hypothetical protein SEA_KARDASHIAN_72 [Streptomyces phage Kardashian]|nr:hypothetical protein SEA_KARDASHIAN_72 [Streptomyces phage Kardashian]